MLNINIYNQDLLTLGRGIFYHYGYHNLKISNDNFTFKYALGFTFK